MPATKWSRKEGTSRRKECSAVGDLGEHDRVVGLADHQQARKREPLDAQARRRGADPGAPAQGEGPQREEDVEADLHISDHDWGGRRTRRTG